MYRLPLLLPAHDGGINMAAAKLWAREERDSFLLTCRLLSCKCACVFQSPIYLSEAVGTRRPLTKQPRHRPRNGCPSEKTTTLVLQTADQHARRKNNRVNDAVQFFFCVGGLASMDETGVCNGARSARGSTRGRDGSSRLADEANG